MYANSGSNQKPRVRACPKMLPRELSYTASARTEIFTMTAKLEQREREREHFTPPEADAREPGQVNEG